jgi:hypothetical protein
MAGFDPETGKVVDRDALKSVQAGATSGAPKPFTDEDGAKRTPVLDETAGGRLLGYQVETADTLGADIYPASITHDLRDPERAAAQGVPE